MNAPLPSSAPPPPAAKTGSLLLGVALAWVTTIVGYIVVAFLMGVFSNMASEGGFLLMLVLPWLAMLALIIVFAMRGQSRSAIGVLIGIASIVAVGLLLVAACFGILAASGWH